MTPLKLATSRSHPTTLCFAPSGNGEHLPTQIMAKEAQAGRQDFDVVRSAETTSLSFSKRELALAQYVSPEVEAYPKNSFFDPDGYWAAVYMMPNVIGYNTRLLKAQRGAEVR